MSQVNQGNRLRRARKKEAGPAGGESGARVRSGPGGGGRRRPYWKLIRKGLLDRHRGSYRPPVPYHRTRPHAASANRITTYAAGPEKALCLDRYPMIRIFWPLSLGKTLLAGRVPIVPGRVSIVRHCPLAEDEPARYTILAVVMPPDRPARDRRGTRGEPPVYCM